MTDQEFTISQLAGTDALGRKITPATGRKEKKYVGIYYFLWHGYHTQKIYDTAKILEKYENGIVGNPENPLWEINPASPNYDATVSPNAAINSERDFRKTQQKISNNIENSLQMIA